MKSLRPLVFSSALALAACHQPTAQQTPPPDDQEVERRVQQRLADEHRAEDERRAKEHEQQLAEREQHIAARERELQAQQQAAAAPTAPPEQPAETVATQTTRSGVADSYQIFYDSLAPYGTWVELENYGYVWQPRATTQSARWRPYTVGQWSHTDYGYTWISKEPFGWATYHYGRWARLRKLGWVWIPGQEWGPAWVSWRYSDRYVGWAPLPPEARWDKTRGIRDGADEQFDIATEDYVFVPGSEFGDDDLASAGLPQEQNVEIVSDTVNVTNIVQTNAFIVNYGPDFAAIRSRSRRPISELRVERRPAIRGGANGPEVRGQTVDFAAPEIRQPDRGARPQQVAPRTADTKLNTGHRPKNSARPRATPGLSVVPPAAATPVQTPATPLPARNRPVVTALSASPTLPAATPPQPAAADLQRAPREQMRQARQQQENLHPAAPIPVQLPGVSDPVAPSASPLQQIRPGHPAQLATPAQAHPPQENARRAVPAPVQLPAAVEQVAPTSRPPRRAVTEPPATVTEPPVNSIRRAAPEAPISVPVMPPKVRQEHRPAVAPNAVPEGSSAPR